MYFSLQFHHLFLCIKRMLANIFPLLGQKVKHFLGKCCPKITRISRREFVHIEHIPTGSAVRILGNFAEPPEILCKFQFLSSLIPSFRSTGARAIFSWMVSVAENRFSAERTGNRGCVFMPHFLRMGVPVVHPASVTAEFFLLAMRHLQNGSAAISADIVRVISL